MTVPSTVEDRQPEIPAPHVDLDPLAALIARLELSTTLLEQHIADAAGNCRACTGQVTEHTWPCSIVWRAERAAEQTR